MKAIVLPTRVIRGVLVSGLALVAPALAATDGAVARANGAPVTITRYTDPGQALAWGSRSQWKQPWRAYLDTPPARTLLDAIGINFNVEAKLAAATAHLLDDSGFKRARLEVGWGSLDYDDPDKMTAAARESLVTTLTALKENGIRPLILLNANEGRPCPVERGTITLKAPAAAGDSTIHVDPADLDQIVPGRTGITENGVAAQVLFTSVKASGAVRLSMPLPEALPAGKLGVVTLRYEPFRPSLLANGEPNPAGAATMRGWLNYVGVVTREAKSILGSEEFDVEVWNELSFGSRFLNINGYYQPDLEWTNNGDEKEILGRTVEFLRDPANGVPAIGIGNGFANQSPWPSGSRSPVGLSAIDKHPYAGLQAFPEDAAVNGNQPLNGLGEPSGWKDATGYHESFTPTYDAFFPEYFLSAIQTETMTRDLSPTPQMIGETAHGRFTHPAGGPPPSVWITEVNLSPLSGPGGSEMSEADAHHIMAKDTLRYLTAYVNKGVTAIDLYAASAGALSLVEPSFLKAAGAKGGKVPYPGDAAGGETMEAVRRLAAAMSGAGPISSPRSLSLRELTDYSGNVQFEGNESAAFPPLYNREVFAFLPFQVDSRRFVVPYYVMTRDVDQVQRPEEPSTDPARYDLPPEPYRLAIGGIDGEATAVEASDPLSGESVPVEVFSRSRDQIVVKVPATDSPRLLTLQESASGQPPASDPEVAPPEAPVSGGAGKAELAPPPAPKTTRARPAPTGPEDETARDAAADGRLRDRRPHRLACPHRSAPRHHRRGPRPGCHRGRDRQQRTAHGR
jgi:hypothetical protein